MEMYRDQQINRSVLQFNLIEINWTKMQPPLSGGGTSQIQARALLNLKVSIKPQNACFELKCITINRSIAFL